MASKVYEESYKYGYKIGVYESRCEFCMEIFKDIFGNKHREKRRRIKWLSNYELNVLKHELIKCIREKSWLEKGELSRKNKFIYRKGKVLKLLR